MLDQVRIAMVGEAGGELPEDSGAPFDLRQQQAAAIGTDGSPVKVGQDFAADRGSKGKKLRRTLCLHDGPPCPGCNAWLCIHLYQAKGRGSWTPR
jgi:hypothetical protein